MILTEEKTYIINVTEVDTDAELGLNKKDIMIKYTNLELLHAVLASTMPYGRLSARYRGKRKAELQSRIAMAGSLVEVGVGDVHLDIAGGQAVFLFHLFRSEGRDCHSAYQHSGRKCTCKYFFQSHGNTPLSQF